MRDRAETEGRERITVWGARDTHSLLTGRNQKRKSCCLSLYDLWSFLLGRIMQGSGLLLVFLCAGSLLTHGGAGGKRKLCGIQLVEALLFVCGEKGLFYQPWGRRAREHKLRKFPRADLFVWWIHSVNFRVRYKARERDYFTKNCAYKWV